MNKIYLATGNLNKKREMQELLPEFVITIPSDEGIVFDPIENGSTFYENSLIKAKALWDIIQEPVIADDSGICVDALGGIPGLYSSRYAGPDFPQGKLDGKKIPQAEQNKFLINQLNETIAQKNIENIKYPHGIRSAHYVCSMVLLLSKDRIFMVQETLEGTIVKDIKDAAGTGGFGYDPIFFIPELNKTAAQLTSDEKNAISHRGKAARIIQKIICNFL